MGNVTGRVRNFLTKPFREYNLHERAHKAVLTNKYIPSPKHPSTQEFIEKTLKELPADVKQKLSNPDISLEERLRQVFVTSRDIGPIQTQSRNPERMLPLDRGHHTTSEFGFHEPKVVPYGKVTLQNALQFISSHQTDPEINSANSIALKHKLDQRLTEQVLKYFGTFRLYVPPQLTAKQEKMLKKLQATPTALPITADTQHRLRGVAMSNTSTSDSAGFLPMQPFPEPAPEPFQSTLLHPTEPNQSGDGIKDPGKGQLLDDAGANDSVVSSKSNNDDAAVTRIDQTALNKKKNSDTV